MPVFVPPWNLLRSQEPPSSSVSPTGPKTGSTSTGSGSNTKVFQGLPFRGLSGLSNSRGSLQLSGRGSIQLGGLPSRWRVEIYRSTVSIAIVNYLLIS